MNERIKELAEQAQVEHCVSHVRLQEFAELIIQECVNALDNNRLWNSDISRALAEHFGVE